MRQKSDIDWMFIGELRTHTGPVKIVLGRTSILDFTDEGGGKNYPESRQAIHV